jgi:uncharacterized protein
MEKLPKQIPIFPLTGAILLPRAHLPLNIFEPRYKEMIEFANSSHGVIGMVQPAGTHISSAFENNDQFGTAHQGRGLYNVGCAGLITNFKETGNGQYFIILKGLRRFRIIEEAPLTQQFREVSADYQPFLCDGDENFNFDPSLKGEFFKTLDIYLKAIEINIDVSNFQNLVEEELINSIAMVCPFEASEKQLLLEAPSLIDRTKIMMKIMDINLSKHDISSGKQIH